MTDSTAGKADPARELLGDLLGFGVHAIDTVRAAAGRLPPGGKDKALIYALALHSTILELFAACWVLAQKQLSAGIPILLRSMYEAIVDLDNLTRDADYIGFLQAADLTHTIKLLKQADTNPFLKGLRQREDVDAELADAVQRLAALRLKGKHPLGVDQRCAKADRKLEYESLYAVFCLDAHNNLIALADRHLSEEGDNTVIRFLAEPSLPTLIYRLSNGLRFLIESAEMIHGAFRTDVTTIAHLKAEFLAQRDFWALPPR